MTDPSEVAVLADEPGAIEVDKAQLAEEDLVEGSSLWQDAWQRLRKNKLALGSLATFILVCLFCVVGPWLMPSDATTQDLFLGATAPSAQHWFGTDTLGRDVMVRTMYGGRISLLVGLVATVVALLIGVIYGATAGYIGGKTDASMMRVFIDGRETDANEMMTLNPTMLRAVEVYNRPHIVPNFVPRTSLYCDVDCGAVLLWTIMAP